LIQNIDTFYKDLGSRIRAVRDEVGLTQTTLAGATGLTRASVANIEAGRQKVLVHHLVTIATALDVEPQALLPGDQPAAGDVERLHRTLPKSQGAFLTAVLKSAGRTRG
jgi:transcriptional regulator with XRE-family HTH domain